ncbi:MAG: ABC transporter ATP-binding protein [Anaerovoracaceae bacterium]|uniref:ABC transporter ATP-binding protein n=1 Tax=Candidatus Allocopromorpha excrementavium TaxID=2840741 RepID=A0A9D1KV28_9FIRM|nr:ABC transporter ATP-binding protein [Candidatus Copromorpha excrementavium]
MNRFKDTLGTVKRLMSYIIMRHKFIFTVVVVCVLLNSFVTVASSVYMQILIDDYITPLITEEAPVLTGMIYSLVVIGIIYAVGVLSALIYNKMMVKVSQGTLKDIRDDMFSHIQKLPVRYFDTHTHGDIMSHYTNDTDTLRQFISQGLPQFISSFVTIIFVVASMIVSNIPLTLLVMAVTAVIVTVTKKIGGASAKYFIRQQKTLGNVTGFIEEMVNGQKVIKVFCHEEKAKQGFDEENEKLFCDADMANKFGNILMPAVMQLGNLQYVLIALIGGLMAIGGVGGVTVGMIVAFLNLSKAFCMPISQIGQQISMVAMALAGAKRIFELIDEEPEKDGGYITLEKIDGKKTADSKDAGEPAKLVWKDDSGSDVSYTELKGNIEFKHVDFGYEKGKEILHDINIRALSGEKVAFVGATGAGKTTITNLINRFYDITAGSITYDGIDISRIKKEDLRRSMGIVLQDVNLFTGTVMENIRYGKLDATDEECIEAAKLANADDFIKRLPDGYDTVLTQNGAGLSQGQRQLISIARAAVADPPVMILDEATSSIDTRTEALVQEGMDNLMKGRTVFVIAHRLSTVKNSDEIIVLDHGHIIEKGTHRELIDKGGVYCGLYTGAFELE